MARSKETEMKATRKTHKPLTDEALELIAARFRVLAEPMRLKILNTLGHNEMSVGELVEATGALQANISKHLGVLLDGGLVTRRKEGLSVIYRIADQTIFDLCETVCVSLGERLAAQQQTIKRALR